MDEEILSARLQSYLDGLVPPRPKELEKMEEIAQEGDFPIIGPSCGHLCYLITRMIRASRIFELGSGYGYSTAWFARGIVENGGGTVHHVVWDDALSAQAKGHLDTLGYENVVTYQVGEAIEMLRQTPGPFDLIFNDIDKEAYPDALPAIEDKLRPGGVLIVDNLLWHGRIFDDEDHSPPTNGIRAFTQQITGSDCWVSSVVPLRDGLLVAMKK